MRTKTLEKSRGKLHKYSKIEKNIRIFTDTQNLAILRIGKYPDIYRYAKSGDFAYNILLKTQYIAYSGDKNLLMIYRMCRKTGDPIVFKIYACYSKEG